MNQSIFLCLGLYVCICKDFMAKTDLYLLLCQCANDPFPQGIILKSITECKNLDG